MNDNVVSANPSSPAEAQKQRSVFYTGNLPMRDEADVDNGVLPERKGLLGYNNHFSNRRKATIEALKELGATDVLYLHPQANVAYFYNAQKKVFGFYYTGQVQFVCPIENFIAFDFGGGGQRVRNATSRIGMVGIDADGVNAVGVGRAPTLVAESDLDAWAILSYREGSEIKEFQMQLTTMDSYVIHFFEGDDGYQMQWRQNMDELLKNLKTLQFKLNTLQSVEVGKEEDLPDVEVEFYAEKNVALGEDYQKYLEELKEETLRDNQKDVVKNVAMFGGLGALIVGAVIWILSLI